MYNILRVLVGCLRKQFNINSSKRKPTFGPGNPSLPGGPAGPISPGGPGSPGGPASPGAPNNLLKFNVSLFE